MSDQIQEFLEVPRDFIKDGTQFINRCTKRKSSPGSVLLVYQPFMNSIAPLWVRFSGEGLIKTRADQCIADGREFIKISQAVGIGFLVMGAVGYLVKLSEFTSSLRPTL